MPPMWWRIPWRLFLLPSAWTIWVCWGIPWAKLLPVKAGIHKPGCEVVSAHQPLEVLSVLKDRAGEKGCVFARWI